jgi:putative ABC transport system ATP-binding protein
MNVLGCLDTPTDGYYLLDGIDTGGLSRDALAEIRNKKLGFVFQGFNLLSRTSALENVELPLLYNGFAAHQRQERARKALKSVGLEGREGHHPNQLSGGQQQRVAIARAVVTDPTILVADEPTGDLDRHSAGEILDLMDRLNRESGKTIIMVTHDPRAAEKAHLIRHLEKGELSDASQ